MPAPARVVESSLASLGCRQKLPDGLGLAGIHIVWFLRQITCNARQRQQVFNGTAQDEARAIQTRKHRSVRLPEAAGALDAQEDSK